MSCARAKNVRRRNGSVMAYPASVRSFSHHAHRAAGEAARVTLVGFGVRVPVSDDPTDVGPLYRWGWMPLVIGCLLIAVVAIGGTEALLTATGLVVRDPRAHLVSLARAVVTSTLLASWAGWDVLRTRGRIEAAREEIRARKRVLEAQAQRAEQAAGVGAVSRILAHELRNPLNTIAIHCELLKRRAEELDGAGSALQPITAVLQAESARLKELVDDYITYGRIADVRVRPVPIRLEELVRSIAECEAPLLQERRITLVVEGASDLPDVSADPSRMAEAIQYLLRRARESVADGGSIAVSLREDGQYVRLTVRDDGPGFEDPTAVFRPFFMATGVGLRFAITRDIVRAHGGDIQASNMDGGGGACITMRLPVVPKT
jgi:signal transduction histidine kinase